MSRPPSITQDADPNILDLPTPLPSYYTLQAKAFALRQLARVGLTMHHRLDPPAPVPSSSTWIDATVGSQQGKQKIKLDVWYPDELARRSHPRSKVPSTGPLVPSSADQKSPPRPCVIIFHGGGFVLGAGSDDSRWASAVCADLGAVAIAVNYRLAPSYPFPIPVEDCVSAFLHIHQHAASFHVDPRRLILSGFSAGGNLAFSSFFLLCQSQPAAFPLDAIKGIATFYPLLDYSIARDVKRKTCVRPDLTLPPALTTTFDASYLSALPDRSLPHLSPSRASDALLDKLPPIHLALAEYDMLLKEGMEFAERVRARKGGEGLVTVRMAEAERHGWDRTPPNRLKERVAVEYVAAMEEMRKWLE